MRTRSRLLNSSTQSRMVCHRPHRPSGQCWAAEPATRGGAREPAPTSSPWEFSPERPGAHAWGPPVSRARLPLKEPRPASRPWNDATSCPLWAPLFGCPDQPGGPGAALTPSQDWSPGPHSPAGLGTELECGGSTFSATGCAACWAACARRGGSPARPASLESGRAGWPSGTEGEAQTR